MLSPSRCRTHLGFTLVELMVVLAISALLAAVSYPSYAAHVRMAKRAEAVARLTVLQQAQENWRANNDEYGSLGDLGIAAESDGSAYRLSMTGNDRSGYIVYAQALGAQSSDTSCRVLRLTVSDGNPARTSGADRSVANDVLDNSRCWIQ